MYKLIIEMSEFRNFYGTYGGGIHIENNKDDEEQELENEKEDEEKEVKKKKKNRKLK